jgi:hypothetical protein
VNSVSPPIQSAMPRRSSIGFFAALLLSLAQYYFIKFFYASISSDFFRDLQSYQTRIDDLSGESFKWDLFSPEVILHRTFVYDEFFYSIIFQITGALGGTAIELHAATITTLTLTCIFLQLNRRTNACFVLIITLACPFLFANLLLGNTRQLCACILILLFYGRIPLFEFFKNCGLSRLALFTRIALFSLVILGTHIGSIVIFATILVIDYFAALHIKYGEQPLGALVKGGGKLILFAAIIYIGHEALNQVDELWRIQSKLDFYSSEKGLDSYPYLTGGFFYLIILPLSVDIFHSLKRKPSIKTLRFPMMSIWFLIFLSFLLPISHALDRVLTSLLLLIYVRRLAVGSLKNEYIYVFIRLLAAAYYVNAR